MSMPNVKFACFVFKKTTVLQCPGRRFKHPLCALVMFCLKPHTCELSFFCETFLFGLIFCQLRFGPRSGIQGLDLITAEPLSHPVTATASAPVQGKTAANPLQIETWNSSRYKKTFLVIIIHVLYPKKCCPATIQTVFPGQPKNLESQ